MKKAVIRTYGKLIGAILTFLGLFTGCEQSDSGGITPLYGVPSATFIVKGNVKDAQASTPIRNIRVVVPYANLTQKGDTVFTDANGNYEIKMTGYTELNQQVKVIASDVDGISNGGVYQSDTLKIQFTSGDKIANGSNWNSGTYQKTGQNFSLKYGMLAMYGVMVTSYKEKDEH
jgi:putative lipoprotein (rSAM/lipoprotein system)